MTEYPHPGWFFKYSFALLADKTTIRYRMEAVRKKPKKRKTNLDDVEERAVLFAQFLRVRSAPELVTFMNHYGHPFKGALLPGMQGQKLTPETPVDVLFSAQELLDMAAALRWIFECVDAVNTQRHELLRLWIKETPVEVARLPEDDPFFGHLPFPKDWYELKWFIRSGDPGDEDFQAFGKLFNAKRTFRVDATDWNRSPEKERMAFAKQELSGVLNSLMQRIHPTLTTDWEPGLRTTEVFDAMILALFDEMTNEAIVGICRNPRCETRFFVRTRNQKTGRRPRSDKVYCGGACQRIVHKRSDLGGPVRKKILGTVET